MGLNRLRKTRLRRGCRVRLEICSYGLEVKQDPLAVSERGRGLIRRLMEVSQQLLTGCSLNKHVALCRSAMKREIF